MRKAIFEVGIVAVLFAIFCVSAHAQVAAPGTTVTNSNDGIQNTVPVYSGYATLGNSSISGKVGIGTTATITPIANLDIYTSATAAIPVSSITAPGAQGLVLRTNQGGQDDGPNLMFGGPQGIFYSIMAQAHNGPRSSLVFYGNPSTTWNAGTSLTQAMVLDYAGDETLSGTLTATGITLTAGGFIKFPDGSVQSKAANGVCGGDYAESIDVTGDRTAYSPGDVLVLDPENPGKFLKSVEPYSTSVSGIYSTKPGMVGRRQLTPKSDAEVPMAVVGIVPAKVSDENGPIKVGDLLVSSSTAGYAMKGADRSRMLGAVIGKAMGTLDSGKGVVEVLVTLQ